MANIEFEQPDAHSFYTNKFIEREKTGLVNWLIKTGIAKNERVANFILIAVIILFVLISGFLIANTFSSKAKPLTEAQKKSALTNTPHAPR